MNIYHSLTALFVAPGLTITQSFFAQSSQLDANEKLEMRTKPAVVRIVNGCYGTFEYQNQNYPLGYGGLATGYFINPDGYIATHAVTSKQECEDRLYINLARKLKWSQKDIDIDRLKEEVPPDKPIEYKNDVILPKNLGSNEPLNFDIVNSDPPLGEKGSLFPGRNGQDVAIIKVEVENAPVLELSNSDTNSQEPVTVIGYPLSVDALPNFENLLNNKVPVEKASVVQGIISNTDKKLKDNSSFLQLSVGEGYGIAGSPVLNENGKVIGMIATETDYRSLNYRVKGNPIAVPASTISEFFDVDNVQGMTDEFYFKGLKLFWQGKYAEAIKQFEKVMSFFPLHSEAGDLIRESLEKEGKWQWQRDAPIVSTGIVGIILGLFKKYPEQSKQILSAISFQIIKFIPGRKRTKSLDGGNAVLEPAPNPILLPGKAFIELEHHNKAGEVVSKKPLKLELDKDVHRLGRDSDWSDLIVPTNWEIISRHHAILRKEEGGDYRIFDNSSRNGLWIDESTSVDIRQGYLLKDGERLLIGHGTDEWVELTYFNPNNGSQEQIRPTRWL